MRFGKSMPDDERRLDPHLDHELERGPQTLRLPRTADEILDILAAYIQRIPDSGH